MKKNMSLLCMVVLAVTVLFLSGGCVTSMIASALVPKQDARPKKSELAYNEAVNVKVIDALVKLHSGAKEGDKVPLAKIINAIDRQGKRAHGSGKPSTLAMFGNQILGNTTRPMVERGLQDGFQWTKGLVGQLAGGVGGTGVIAMLMRSRSRKIRALNVFKTELNPDELAKVKKATEHTGLQNEVS